MYRRSWERGEGRWGRKDEKREGRKEGGEKCKEANLTKVRRVCRCSHKW